MAVILRGTLTNDAGVAINGATVEVFTDAINADESTGSPTATDTTDSNGEWDFTGLAEGIYDVRITNGTSLRWRRYRDEIQANRVQIGDDGELNLGNSVDAALTWSKFDATNHALVLGVGASNQVLHIASYGDRQTDWNVAANAADSEVWIHSSTTPATDYLSIGGHDGTTAYIDVVGGTTLAIQIGGTTSISFATRTLTVFAGDTGDATQIELRSAASGTNTLATVITFREGDGSGGANNMAYDLGYNANGNYLRLFSHDIDGASADADIWRVLDGQTSIDANTTWDDNIFDKYDDAMLLSPYREGQLNFAARREDLIRIGVLKEYNDGWIGYNDQRMSALLAGGIYQTRSRMDAQYEELDRRLKAIGA